MDAQMQSLKECLKKTISHLKEEFAKLQTGRASATLIENVLVEAYGQTQPLKALAGISVQDAKTIVIQPWDKSVLVAVEKAIQTHLFKDSFVNSCDWKRLPLN